MADNKIFEKKSFVKVLKVMGAISAAAEVFCPFSGLAGSIIKGVADYLDDEDIENLKGKFETVNQGLDKISDQIQQARLQIIKEVINLQYSTTAENLRKQFCDFMEVLEAEPGEREDKKQAFIKSYVQDGGVNNMHHLYKGVVEEKQVFNHCILIEPEKNSDSEKQAKEALCTQLTYLFCIGFVSMMGYYAFKRDDLLTRYTEWEEMLKEVNSMMQAYLMDCK